MSSSPPHDSSSLLLPSPASPASLPLFVPPAPSPHLAAVQQLKDVLAQLTAVTNDSERVMELEARLSQYENMLGTASLSQRKFQATIQTLERQLAETKSKHNNQTHEGKATTAATAAAAAAATASAGSTASPAASHSATAAAHLAASYSYPIEFESNLSQFLMEHVELDPHDDYNLERWSWSDFPESSSSNASAGTASLASASAIPSFNNDLTSPTLDSSSARTLPPSTLDKLLRLHVAQPLQLYECPRLSVGFEFDFEQMHQLVYLQTVTAMQMQGP